jgi:hypothetical protein
VPPLPHPGRHHRVRQVPARLHQEGAAAHRRVAHLQVQDALARGCLSHRPEQRLQRLLHDRRRQAARRVVRARPPALRPRLHHQLPRRAPRRPRLPTHPRQLLQHVQDLPPRLRPAASATPDCRQRLRHLLGLALRHARRLLQPLAAGRRLLRKHLLRRHPHLRRLHAHRVALQAHHVVAHQRLVDRADLLHVERAVRQPLAPQHQQPLEHLVDRLVVDARQPHRRARRRVDDRRRPRLAVPALEERVLLRREQRPAPRRHRQVVVLHAQVDRAEQRRQPAVGAEAARHRVGVRAVIVLQPIEQPEHAQVLRVQRVIDREQAAILRVQHEHQPQQVREQSAVEVIVPALVGRVEHRAPVALRRRLEPAQQHLQRVEHLLGQLVGDVGLPLPALGEDRRQLALDRDAGHPRGAEQHHQRVEDRPAADLEHVGHAERDRAR